MTDDRAIHWIRRRLRKSHRPPSQTRPRNLCRCFAACRRTRTLRSGHATAACRSQPSVPAAEHQMLLKCLGPCSDRVGLTPLKPRCRNIFDPGVFSCANGETSTKSHQYPKSSQQLALSDVLCRLPLSKNRDTAKRRSRVDSVPKNALCLSKTQRHSPRVKTLIGFTVNSWNSNSTSGVMRPWGYGPKIEGRCSWQSGSLERTIARSKINHIVVEFKREGMIHPYSRRRLGW